MPKQQTSANMDHDELNRCIGVIEAAKAILVGLTENMPACVAKEDLIAASTKCANAVEKLYRKMYCASVQVG